MVTKQEGDVVPCAKKVGERVKEATWGPSSFAGTIEYFLELANRMQIT